MDDLPSLRRAVAGSDVVFAMTNCEFSAPCLCVPRSADTTIDGSPLFHPSLGESLRSPRDRPGQSDSRRLRGRRRGSANLVLTAQRDRDDRRQAERSQAFRQQSGRSRLHSRSTHQERILHACVLHAEYDQPVQARKGKLWPIQRPARGRAKYAHRRTPTASSHSLYPGEKALSSR